MSPPADTNYKQLIRRGSVKLLDPGHPDRWGTGFFVAHDLILTCWHVVRDGPLESNTALEAIKVLQSDPVGAATVAIGTAGFLERAAPWDLALLRFWPDREQAPAEKQVVLPLQQAEPTDQAPLFVGAFPVDANGWHEANYLYPGRTTLGDPPLPYLRLKHDGVVGGFSGAALIDKARWWVCGVVSRNDLPGGAIDGGLAVPLTLVQLDTAFPLLGAELLRRNRSEADPQLLEPPASIGPPTTRRILSSIDSPPQVTGLVGREPELEQLAALMGTPGNNRHVVVHGVSGVGKSELLREYARRHVHRYPGGRYWINCSLGPTEELLRIGRQYWGLDGLEGTAAEQAGQVLRLLAAEAVLLIYDNATAEDVLAEWLPPDGKAHVLVSSVSRDWGPPLFQEWNPDGLQPLSRQSGEALVELIAGRKAADQLGDQLLRSAGGLPMQIIPSAQALGRLARNGRLNRAEFLISQEAENSFALPWGLLSSTARLLLQAAAGLNTDAMAESEVLLPVAEALGGQRCVEDALDECRDLHLIEGIGSLRIHQLLANFVAAQPAEPSSHGTSLDQLRRLQAAAMVEAAKAVNANPADPAGIDRFLSYPLVLERWAVWSDSIAADGFEAIGMALYELGRFSIALSWFEQAQAEARQGDLHGRVDHESLGTTLHQIGICFYQQGEWAKAAEWFEQAQAEARQGDRHGRVDHQGLGTTLHQIGNCFYQQGEWAKAAEWFEQAQAEARQGDRHGRVDHQSLGSTLHQIGNCFYQQGEWAKAAEWFEQAQAEKGQGDRHGRVDHQSLGTTLHQIGNCFYQQGEWAKAAEWFEQAQAEARQGDLHGRVDHEGLGSTLHQIGNCFYQQGEWAKAAEWFEQAQAEKGQGDLHGRVDHQSLGTTLHEIGNCFYQQGEWAKAAEWFEQAQAEKGQGDLHGRVDHQSLGTTLHQIGNCFYQQGEWAKAAEWFEQAQAEKGQGDLHGRVDHQSLGTTLHQIGNCFYQQREWAKAAEWFEQAQAKKGQGDRHGRVDHESLGTTLHQIGNCFYQQGEWAKAAEWFEQAQAEARQGDLHGRVDHQSLGTTLHQIGNCFYQQGEWAKAAEWFEQAQAEKGQGDLHGRVDHQSLGTTLHQIGNCFYQQGEWAKAAEWFEQAQAEARQGDLHGRVDHEGLGTTLHNLGMCFYQQGEWAKAAEWFEQAQAEKSQGDIYRRINKQSIAISLRALVMVLKCLGREKEALRWQAIADQFEFE